MPDAQIDEAVEALCQRGCRHVLAAIDALERGEVPARLLALTAAQRRAVLAEIKSIMAVYGGACSTEAPASPTREPATRRSLASAH